MKIAFFRPGVGRTACQSGALLLGSILRQEGHDTTHVSFSAPGAASTAAMDRHVQDVAAQADVVMMTVYTATLDFALRLTRLIRQTGTPVIWGGPHCVSTPELSVGEVDGVCFSEGEPVIVEFVDRFARQDGSHLTVPNFAFEVNGRLVKNLVVPPVADLDSLPFIDVDFAHHLVMTDDGPLPMDERLAVMQSTRYFGGKPSISMLTSRGCPQVCTYCNNIRYLKLWGKANKVRYQSVDRFMSEIEHLTERLPFMEGVLFGDDDFVHRPLPELQKFAERYKRTVGLPFMIEASANNMSPEKLDLLVDAGLSAIEMGVQSASPRVLQKVYKRGVPITAVRRGIEAAKKHTEAGRLMLLLDLITDNPFETEADVTQTVDFMLEMRQRNSIQFQVFCLAFLPGTEIHERAVEAGIVDPINPRNQLMASTIHKGDLPTCLIYLLALSLLPSPWPARIPAYATHLVKSSFLYRALRTVALLVGGIARKAPTWSYRLANKSAVRGLFRILPRRVRRGLIGVVMKTYLLGLLATRGQQVAEHPITVGVRSPPKSIHREFSSTPA